MPPAYRAHPEFGYFCPSRTLRRRTLKAFVLLVVAVLVGLAALRSDRLVQDGRKPAVAAADAAFAVEPLSAPAVETSTAIVKNDCVGASWTHRNEGCGYTIRKVQGPHGATGRAPLAAIPLGRSPPPAETPVIAPKPERVADAAASPPPPDPLPPQKPARLPDAAASAVEPSAVPAATAKARPVMLRKRASLREPIEDGRPHERQRSGRADVFAPHRSPRQQSPGWQRQLRAGEHLLRTFLSVGI